MKNKVIEQGAEAIISLSSDSKKVFKSRIKKSYRIKFLDDKIRKLRTRGEAKLLKRASLVDGVFVPQVFDVNEKTHVLDIEFIDGKKLSTYLNKLRNKIGVVKCVGEAVGKLHDNNVVHGDLTTSNMILQKNTGKIFFIDFGLGFYSEKFEDKAVDIHLFKQALEAKHFRFYDSLLKAFLNGYKKSKVSKQVLYRLKKVEGRGRYKH